MGGQLVSGCPGGGRIVWVQGTDQIMSDVTEQDVALGQLNKPGVAGVLTGLMKRGCRINGLPVSGGPPEFLQGNFFAPEKPLR